MSDRKIVRPGNTFNTEVSNALFKLTVATGITFSGTVATVTCASHLMATGDYVTYSGTTGAGATVLNGATWGPVTRTSSSVYTFPCTIASTVTAGGTIVQEKLYFPPAGDWMCLLGANGTIEYNSDNGWGAVYPTSSAGGDTWRVAIAASAGGYFTTDGIAVRFRENGTTATSYFSQFA